MKIDDSTEILEIRMLDIKIGEESLLYKRPGSAQHFMKEFEYANYHIQLRLDWDDIIKGEPMLDADIWIENKNKKKSFLKKGHWHHTERAIDKNTGLYIYKFRFDNLELILLPKTTIAKMFDSSINLVKTYTSEK